MIIENHVTKEMKSAMSEATTETRTGNEGLATASLVLGCVAIVIALTIVVWYLAILVGSLAIVFGILSLQSRGRKKAIAGIVTGIVGMLLSILLLIALYSAAPALLKNQRDTARKTDITTISSEVSTFQANNRGQLPAASDLTTARLHVIETLSDSDEPSISGAVYTVGEDCNGVPSARAYKVQILLESGSHYCQGS